MMIVSPLFVSLPVFAGEGDVAIDEEHFPDAKFRAYILEKIDTNENGILETSEAEAVKRVNTLDFEYPAQDKINSLQGLEYFPNLERVDMHEENISELDLSSNKNLADIVVPGNGLESIKLPVTDTLTGLNLSSNKLKSIDLMNNPNLVYVDLSKNQLTSLDLSKHIELGYLNVSDNALDSLILPETTELSTLFVSNNNLKKLDVSKYPELYALACSENNLTSLDVSKNSELNRLVVSKNHLTVLDVSNNSHLELLRCVENNLTSLDLSNTRLQIAAGWDEINNSYDITVGPELKFDLTNLPGNFDVTKVKEWSDGAKTEGNILVLPDTKPSEITYKYDSGRVTDSNEVIEPCFQLNITYSDEPVSPEKPDKEDEEAQKPDQGGDAQKPDQGGDAQKPDVDDADMTGKEDAEAENVENPETGETESPALWLSLIFLSLAGLVFVTMRRKYYSRR